MAKEAYINKRFGPAAQVIIDQANQIIEEYMEQGYDLTLRQLYYQFVARGIIENSQREYHRLGVVINDGRLAGYIDWDAIKDRSRNLNDHARWESPTQILDACVHSFKLDAWKGQPYQPEVWVEKEALVGVIGTICTPYRVPYFACKGYVSQSEMWAAAQRMRYYVHELARIPVIIHLGDHDPSGVDMTRDIRERLELFLGAHMFVLRVALNMDQVEELNPPPNPAKFTDSRCGDYVRKYGTKSWELDALEPAYLDNLVSQHILHYRDADIHDKVMQEEQGYIRKLEHIRDNWEKLDFQTKRTRTK